MTSLTFAIASLLSATSVLTWLQYMNHKELHRLRRHRYLRHYNETRIYKGTDCE